MEKCVDKHSARICAAIHTSSYDGFTRRAHHLKQTEELFRLRLLLCHILRLLRGGVVVVPFLSRLCVSLRLFDFLPPRLLNLSDLFGFDFRSKPTQRADNISSVVVFRRRRSGVSTTLVKTTEEEEEESVEAKCVM